MYIIIGSTTYTQVKNLRFAPQADVTGITTPVNEFTADIITDSPLTPGAFAALYDDRDNLWARYWITESVKLNPDTLRITAKSLLWPLDKVELPAVMYSGATAQSILDDVFARISGQYTLDSAFSSATITGFCPEQTARERLQWVCFILGAYVKTHFCADVQILPIPEDFVIIPADKTFWRPEMASRTAVAAVRAKAWTFTAGTPAPTDQWVTDGTTTWIAEEQWVTVSNPSVGELSPSSVVSVEDVTLINANNVSAVLNRLGGYYFKPREISLSVINNGDYQPGDAVMVHPEAHGDLVHGYIDSASFSFGVQARSQLHVTCLTTIEAAGLTIIYRWTHEYGYWDLFTAQYSFPAGYAYEIENPWFDKTNIPPNRRYIFRPDPLVTTGTMPGESAVIIVPCYPTLIHHYDWDAETMTYGATGYLEVISVDELTQNAEGVIIIT